MWKIRVNRRFLTCLLFISAILFNVQLINTEIINGNNSLETYLPNLIPNEDAIINSNQTSHIATISSIEEEEIQSTANTPESTTQIEEDQAHNIIINDQTSSTLDTTEEATNPIEYNIKHEISNPPLMSIVESRIIPTITESSNSQLLSIADTRLLPPNEDMVKVQKCCPSGQIMILGQPGEQSICQVSSKEFNIPVFYTNSTHYWNYTNTAAGDVDIVPRDPCKQSKFFLDPNDENDTFRLLSNSSLYIPFSMDMFNIDQYCVDTIQGSDAIFTTAIICTSPPKIDIFHILYNIGLFISIVSLISLVVYSMRRKDIKEDHKKCLAFYAGTMATAYIFIGIQTIWHNNFNHNINLIIAYLIYYLNLNYYLWLNMLSYDTYRCVRDSNIDTISYMKWYIIVTFSVPVTFVLLSFIDGFNPPLPNLYLEHKFSSSNTFVILLYIVPVIISTIVNIIILCSLSLPKERYNNVKDLIATLQSKNWKAPPRNIREIKKMYRRTLALFVIILIFFVLDVAIYFLPSTGKQEFHFIMRDVIYCLQGLIISLTFVRTCKICKNRGRSDDTIGNETEMIPMTNGTV